VAEMIVGKDMVKSRFCSNRSEAGFQAGMVLDASERMEEG
jgi:hypothetical protein